MSNNVQNPQHYNAHPAGIECIEVIRHYTCDIANAQKYLWRAGLKPEQGISDRDKEIEDLEKSLFYIARRLYIVAIGIHQPGTIPITLFIA